MSPLIDQLMYVGQRAERVSVEQLAVKRAVEAFDVRIPRRLAGLNLVQGNILLRTPFTQFGANKLWAVVGAQLRRAVIALG